MNWAYDVPSNYYLQNVIRYSGPKETSSGRDGAYPQVSHVLRLLKAWAFD
jgi:hypothetical protein